MAGPNKPYDDTIVQIVPDPDGGPPLYLNAEGEQTWRDGLSGPKMTPAEVQAEFQANQFIGPKPPDSSTGDSGNPVAPDSAVDFARPPIGDPGKLDVPVEGFFELYKEFYRVNPTEKYSKLHLERFTQEQIDQVNEVGRKESGKKARLKLLAISNKYSTQDFNNEQKHESLVQEQAEKDEEGKQERVASQEEWDGAWKAKQRHQRTNNYGKPTQDPTNPTPLLVDKISSLPPGSPRRNCYENVKGVLENNTANIGSGTDTVTRESYKEIKNLVKSSDMLQQGVTQPLPAKENLLGVENGTVVNNLQSWEPTLANAVKPVSDAIGSHADTSSSINKTPMGPDQLLPQTAAVQAQVVTPDAVSETEKGFKANQKSNLLQTPSKCVGSLRQLATCSIPAISFPFDLVSDVYNGLMNLVKQVSKLIDGIMAQITQFAISAIGGLVDGLFPSGLLAKLIAFVTKIAGMLQFLFNLLGGFAALAKIAQKVEAELPLGCTGDLFAANNSKSSKKTNNYASLANKAGQVASAAGAIIGSLPNIGNALGNLGNMIGGAIPKNLGDITAQISNPANLLKGMFDDKINKLLSNLPWCCAVGCTGDNGFSVGTALDGLNNNAFTKAMSEWATHASIISPNFNKKATSIGSFAQAFHLDEFTKAPFAKGADSSKGVIMYAPGATSKRKIFKI